MEELRGNGLPMVVGSLEEVIDDHHAIVSTDSGGMKHYVTIMSFVDKDLLQLGCSVLLRHNVYAIVGVLPDDSDPAIRAMQIDKAPTETYADIGGLETQVIASDNSYSEFYLRISNMVLI